MSSFRLPALALSLIAFALIVAGCGGSSSSSYSSAQPSESTASNGGGSSSATGATVATASNPELGTVLVNSQGFTVYEFAKDRGTTSTCYGSCAEFWPPVTTEGAPSSGEGAQASKLGTTKRKDGTVQVTYAGRPLYTFSEDEQPGEANGNGLVVFGGVWKALDQGGAVVASSSANEAESTAASAEGGAESSGGGRYGY